MTDLQWLRAALLTAAVVHGAFVIAAVFLSLRARNRAARDQIIRAMEMGLLSELRRDGLI